MERSYRRGVSRLMIDLGTLGAPASLTDKIDDMDIHRIVLSCRHFLRVDWWLGIGRTAPNTRWRLCLDLEKGLDPPVNAFGRRWTWGKHVLDEWENGDLNELAPGLSRSRDLFMAIVMPGNAA